jgi:hypothetical protein
MRYHSSPRLVEAVAPVQTQPGERGRRTRAAGAAGEDVVESSNLSIRTTLVFAALPWHTRRFKALAQHVDSSGRLITSDRCTVYG